jgi:long-chain-fatty-acid--CoA ligase ACSBG
MGYFRNPDESQLVIDDNGYLHSGDMGKINQDNVLFITGRVKELIITSGGENIPPLLIENEIKAAMPFISNVMVVGDQRNYLTCLITIKEDPPGSGKL